MILAGILFFIGKANGQVKISGKVLDAETKKPIHSAHIIEALNSRAAITDSLGSFSIEVTGLPVLLSVSHLSFHPQAVIVDRIIEEGLLVELISKNVQINEVIVLA